MKPHLVIALVTVFIGIVFVGAGVFLMIIDSRVLNWLLLLTVGVLLCVAGFVLLVTELLEAWLSRGQKALVDGLQAG